MRMLRVFRTGVAMAALVLAYATVAQVETPVVRLEKLPRGKFTAFIPATGISQVEPQLRQYSAKQGFKFQARDTRPDQRHVLVELDRADARIIVLNPFDPVDPAEFRVTVYDASKDASLESHEVATLLEQLGGVLCGITAARCTPATLEGH